MEACSKHNHGIGNLFIAASSDFELLFHRFTLGILCSRISSTLTSRLFVSVLKANAHTSRPRRRCNSTRRRNPSQALSKRTRKPHTNEPAQQTKHATTTKKTNKTHQTPHNPTRLHKTYLYPNRGPSERCAHTHKHHTKNGPDRT